MKILKAWALTGILTTSTVVPVQCPLANTVVEPPGSPFSVKGGSVETGVVFSAPEGDDYWRWRLGANAVEGWSHIDGTQSPAYPPWSPKNFSTPAGYWITALINNDHYERHFQIPFRGLMSRPGEGEIPPEFLIEARTDSEYFVLPSHQFICVNSTGTVKAVDGEANPVLSNWSVDTGSPVILLPPTSNVTNVQFTVTQPGGYIITGANADNPDQSDLALATFIKVEVEGPEWTIEGLDSGVFKANVFPGSVPVDAYIWKARWPDNVGHNPGVNFAAPNERETIISKAQWYAVPDKRRFLDMFWKVPDDYAYCEYEIQVSAVIDGHEFESEEVIWEVRVPTGGGVIVDEIARDLETVVIEQNPNDGLYYVSGQGQFRRVVEPSSGPQVNAPATSDFHNKFMQHELFHIQQWESIDPWGNLWDVDAF